MPPSSCIMRKKFAAIEVFILINSCEYFFKAACIFQHVFDRQKKAINYMANLKLILFI